MRMIVENEFFTSTGYKIVHRIAERGKLFTDGNVIKECMMQAENHLCSESRFDWNCPPFSKLICTENSERT